MNYEERLSSVISGQTETYLFPTLAPLVAMFLKDFRPSEELSGENMTSAEIASALLDIADIDNNVIAEVMLYMGYSIVTNELKGPEWGMTFNKP